MIWGCLFKAAFLFVNFCILFKECDKGKIRIVLCNFTNMGFRSNGCGLKKIKTLRLLNRVKFYFKCNSDMF